MIVDNVPVSEAASAHTMSSQQANVIRARFLTKAEKLRVQEFMQREKPTLSVPALDRFVTEMRILRDKGYTIDQIVGFLEENGVATSPSAVRIFLRSHRA